MRMIPYKCKYFFLDFSKLILQRFWEAKLNVKAIIKNIFVSPNPTLLDLKLGGFQDREWKYIILLI